MFSFVTGLSAPSPVQVRGEGQLQETFCQKVYKCRDSIAYGLDTITAMVLARFAFDESNGPAKAAGLAMLAGVELTPIFLKLILARSGMITVPKPRENANEAA